MRHLEVSDRIPEFGRRDIHLLRIDSVFIGCRERELLGMLCDVKGVLMVFGGDFVQFAPEFIHKIEQPVLPVVREIRLGYFFPDMFDCPVRHIFSLLPLFSQIAHADRRESLPRRAPFRRIH